MNEFQKYFLRQAVNLVVSLLSGVVEKHHKSFSPQQTKAEIQQSVKKLVPESLWGEEFVEGKLVVVTDWMVDTACNAICNSPELAGEILTALGEKDAEGAIKALKSFYLSTIGVDVKSGPAEVQAFDDSFADRIIAAHESNQLKTQPVETKEGEE